MSNKNTPKYRLPTNIDFISTGSLALDRALVIGGMPKGRMIELYGPKSSGKTTLALHVISEAQKNNQTVVFIDTEHKLSIEYAKEIGVKIEDLLISQPESLEDILDITESLINTKLIDVIVIDSMEILMYKIKRKDRIDKYRKKNTKSPFEKLNRLETINRIAQENNTLILLLNKLNIISGRGYETNCDECKMCELKEQYMASFDYVMNKGSNNRINGRNKNRERVRIRSDKSNEYLYGTVLQSADEQDSFLKNREEIKNRYNIGNDRRNKGSGGRYKDGKDGKDGNRRYDENGKMNGNRNGNGNKNKNENEKIKEYKGALGCTYETTVNSKSCSNYNYCVDLKNKQNDSMRIMLKFYASIRIEMEKIEEIKDKEGNIVCDVIRAKIVRSKVAPLNFKYADISIVPNRGISYPRTIAYVGIKMGIIQKAGAWYSHENIKLGQGTEELIEYLSAHEGLMDEIKQEAIIKLREDKKEVLGMA